MKRLALVVFAMSAVSGCATVGNPQISALSVQIVETATTESPVELREAADGGNANAQFSYSIVRQHGLNGATIDLDAASAYRKLALASRGTTNSAIYVPTGKHSGHTQLISIPRYDISGITAKVVDDCVGALDARLKPEAVTTQCGGLANYTRLAELWAKARS